jgi:hypothetical protein
MPLASVRDVYAIYFSMDPTWRSNHAITPPYDRFPQANRPLARPLARRRNHPQLGIPPKSKYFVGERPKPGTPLPVPLPKKNDAGDVSGVV